MWGSPLEVCGACVCAEATSAASIHTIRALGIIDGRPAGNRYGHVVPVRRGQLASMIVRLMALG